MTTLTTTVTATAFRSPLAVAARATWLWTLDAAICAPIAGWLLLIVGPFWDPIASWPALAGLTALLSLTGRRR